MEQKIKENKWLFKQFTIIHRTAISVYSAIQNGNDTNLYHCYVEFQNDVFGWIKENTAFEKAIEIYEQYTANDGWDILNQLENVFGEDLATIEYADIEKWETELADFN